MTATYDHTLILPSANTASAVSVSPKCWSTSRPTRSTTGAIQVQRIVTAHDRPINPRLAESQVYGGVIRGMSYALYEERHLDGATGAQLNANIDQYKMAGSREVPQIEVHLLEQLTGQSSTSWKTAPERPVVAKAATAGG